MKAVAFFFIGIVLFIASILAYIGLTFGQRAFDMLLGAILGSVAIMVVAALTIFTVLAVQKQYANSHNAMGESDTNRVQALSRFGIEVIKLAKSEQQQNALPMLPPITDADYEIVLNDDNEGSETNE